MNNEQKMAGLASDLNRELDTLVAGTLQAANEFLAGMMPDYDDWEDDGAYAEDDC